MWVVVLVLLAVAIVAVLVGVFGIARVFMGSEQTNRMLRKIAVTRVAKTKPGTMARVVGKLRPAAGPLLRAPLSGKSCGYFQAVVQEWQEDGRTTGWTQRAYEERWCDFCLEDSTGIVLVRMLRPQVSADLEDASFSDHVMPPNPAEATFLRKHELWPAGEPRPMTRMRYLESLFELDEEISVYGIVRHETGPNGPIIVLEAPRGGTLLVSDDKQITRSYNPGATVLSMSAIR